MRTYKAYKKKIQNYLFTLLNIKKKKMKFGEKCVRKTIIKARNYTNSRYNQVNIYWGYKPIPNNV